MSDSTPAPVSPDQYPLPELRRLTTPLRLSFYARTAVEVARDLLGCVLLHHSSAGVIVETEAYLGLEDLAAHASRGITERTRVLFGPPGHAYVYFIYGKQECLNVVAERKGHPGCVLIRALAPVTGLAEMYRRRSWHGKTCGLTNGPGKLTEALAITRAQYGARFDRGPLSIRAFREQPTFTIGTTSRIGITHCADWPLRFVWSGHPCLSK